MNNLSWWRSWHGAPTDHKWSVIASRSGSKTGVVSAIAWALLDYASQNTNRGSVEGFDTEEYAVYSGFPEEEIKAVIQAMNDKGIITNGRLTNWEKRQPKREDDSNERVRKFREMKRSVTQCNASDGDETPQIKREIKDTELEREEENSAPSYPVPPEIALFHDVTGLYPTFMDEERVKQKIQDIRKKHKNPPVDVIKQILLDKYGLWKSSTTKDGRPYNPSNPDWLDWCITDYTPKPATPPASPQDSALERRRAALYGSVTP